MFNAVVAIALVVGLAAPFGLNLQEDRLEAKVLGLQPPQCFVLERTGHECPACGLTRSIVALYQGDWELSRKYHPAGVVMFAALLFELLLRILLAFAKSARWLWPDICQMIILGLMVRSRLS